MPSPGPALPSSGEGGKAIVVRDPTYDRPVGHQDFWNDLTAPAGLKKYSRVTIPPGAQSFLHFQERTDYRGHIWTCPGYIDIEPPAIVFYYFGPSTGLAPQSELLTADARMWWTSTTGYANGPRLVDLDPQPAWVLLYMSFQYGATGVPGAVTCPSDGEGNMPLASEVAAASLANTVAIGGNALAQQSFFFTGFSSDLGPLEFDPPGDVELQAGAFAGGLLKRPEDLGGESGYDGAPGNPLSPYLWRPDELPAGVSVVGTAMGGVSEKTATQLSIFPFALDPDPTDEDEPPPDTVPSTVYGGPQNSGVVRVPDVRIGTPGPPIQVTGGGAASQHFSKAQLVALYTAHGAPDPNLVAAIALAESGGDAGAINDENTNGSIDYGLLQINSIHGYDPNRLLEPDYNADAGEAVSSGWTDFTPWVTYNSGAYLDFL